MKKLFSTPKRAVITVICMAVLIAVVSIITVKSALITRAEAKAVALRDAGLSEAEASALRARLKFDDGRFQYDVDFYNNGTEYEYSIQARDGDIIARDIEGGANGNDHGSDLPLETVNKSAADANESTLSREVAKNQPAEDGNRTGQPQENAENQSASGENRTVQSQENSTNQSASGENRTAQSQENSANQSASSENRTVQSQGISIDEAKAAALEDAGLSESDVTFKKTETDRDKGMQVYEIEFYTSDTEYDYKISASDRTVLEKSVEQFQMQARPADNAAGSSGNNYIGVDRAKEIALNHANLKETDVVFAKAKLENDDGRVEYEIEFYSGRTEYEYTIDAVSGNIIEYDVDYD